LNPIQTAIDKDQTRTYAIALKWLFAQVPSRIAHFLPKEFPHSPPPPLPLPLARTLPPPAFPPAAFLAGIPVGLLIMGVLWINQFQDRDADASVNKRHWVVRLGRHAAARVHVVVLGATYVSIILGVIVGLFPVWALLALLAIPLAIKAAVTALMYYDDLGNLTPSNAATIGAHFVTSLLLSVGFVLARVLG